MANNQTDQSDQNTEMADIDLEDNNNISVDDDIEDGNLVRKNLITQDCRAFV